MPDLEEGVAAAANAQAATPPNDAPSAEEPQQQPERTYVAADHYIPETEDVPEVLRGKPVAEAIRLANQWRTEASSANEYNRQLHATQLETAKEMLAQMRNGRQQQASAAEPNEPYVYVPTGDGTQAVPVPLSQLIAPYLGQINQKVEEAEFRNFQTISDTAHRNARPANVPPQLWNELKPELAMYMGVRSMRTDSEDSWREAFRGTYGRHAQMVAGAPQQQMAPTPPAGAAMSMPSKAQAGMPKLSREDQQTLDGIVGKLGVKPGSKTYIEIAKQVASGYQQGGR